MEILIGKVLKPQGVKGEVKVLPITDDPARFLELEEVYCGGELRKIAACAVREGYVYLSLEGCPDRNAAELLRGRELTIPRERAVALPEDSWFVCDLIGCCVEDGKGERLGNVTDILQNGGVDVYVIQSGKLMFPALKRVLQQVDVENKRIVVDGDALSEVAVYAD